MYIPSFRLFSTSFFVFSSQNSLQDMESVSSVMLNLKINFSFLVFIISKPKILPFIITSPTPSSKDAIFIASPLKSYPYMTSGFWDFLSVFGVHFVSAFLYPSWPGFLVCLKALPLAPDMAPCPSPAWLELPLAELSPPRATISILKRLLSNTFSLMASSAASMVGRGISSVVFR